MKMSKKQPTESGWYCVSVIDSHGLLTAELFKYKADSPWPDKYRECFYSGPIDPKYIIPTKFYRRFEGGKLPGPGADGLESYKSRTESNHELNQRGNL